MGSRLDTVALRELPIVCPDRDSTTQFAPFVDVDAKTWVALLDECDRLRAELRLAHEEIRIRERSQIPVIPKGAQRRLKTAEALAARYEQALREIARLPGKGAAGTGASGWLLTLEAPEKARAALAAGSGEERDE